MLHCGVKRRRTPMRCWLNRSDKIQEESSNGANRSGAGEQSAIAGAPMASFRAIREAIAVGDLADQLLQRQAIGSSRCRSPTRPQRTIRLPVASRGLITVRQYQLAAATAIAPQSR